MAPSLAWALAKAPAPNFGMIGGRESNLGHSRGGHSAQNLFGGNMHAPAVSRALAQLILDGDFQTFDLSRMCVQRVL